MRPKGAKGGSQVGPKPQLDPPEPKLVTNPLDPKLAKDLLDTNLAINPVGPPWTNISAMASGNHQRPPDQLIQSSPQLMGNSFHSFIPSVLEVSGLVHIWYYIPLCTILLSNPIVTFSGPISIFPYQGPKIQRPFQRRIIQLISLTSYGSNQKTLQGSQQPVSAGVGFQGIKYFNTPWTTQFIRTGLIQSTCMA
ncbi:hypothetical protein O181_131498 [Austropuccinia psidii MF-1]|uniref:Uncharacterized protein n=1 Tax=Austropuccinia psidii MF-1 TaxID=1389203 RepID=A0A9Q3QAS3_9BASI|nr:hypothetical protein [Austropuccinia psidii MF-1]